MKPTSEKPNFEVISRATAKTKELRTWGEDLKNVLRSEFDAANVSEAFEIARLRLQVKAALDEDELPQPDPFDL